MSVPSGLTILRGWPQHRAMLSIAVPMIISNVTIPLLGLVDTFVIGHLGDARYLGGMALGANVIALIYWLLGFLRMSTTGLVAQSFGAGETQQVVARFAQSGVLALGLALLLILCQWPLWQTALWLAGASDAVSAQATIYFQLRIWSAPAALINLVILGTLLGQQRGKEPMWLLLCTNLVNILLDLLFVLGFGWGVAGAAAATVIAEYIALGLGLTLLQRALGRHSPLLPAWREQLHRLYQLSHWLPLFRLNRDVFIRAALLQACFAFITFYGARLGDNVIAANAVLLNFLLLCSYGLDGIAYASEALFGKAVGQRSAAYGREVLWLTGAWSLLFGAMFTLVFLLLGQPLIQLLTDIPEVRATASAYLPWLWLLPGIALWCFWLDGVFIGATRATEMRNTMLLATLAFFLVWWATREGLQNHALWLSLMVFMGVRGIALAAVLKRIWGDLFARSSAQTGQL